LYEVQYAACQHNEAGKQYAKSELKAYELFDVMVGEVLF
jgi:hypothetical protein